MRWRDHNNSIGSNNDSSFSPRRTNNNHRRGSSSSNNKRKKPQNLQLPWFSTVAIIVVVFTVVHSLSISSLCQALAEPYHHSPWNSRLYNTNNHHGRRAGGSANTRLSSHQVFSSSTIQDVQINGDENDRTESEGVHLTTSEVLSLDSIRASLIRQEETIIFALIERAQFRQNLKVYQPGGLGPLLPMQTTVMMDATATTTTTTTSSDGGNDHKHQQSPSAWASPSGSPPLSFLEYMLMGTEALHSAVRRYMSPEEHAFFPDRLVLEGRVLDDLEFPTLLSDLGGAATENFNPVLLQKYVEWVVPSICRPGDDEQHGSTALCDVALLQALSKRVHYGKFVAESKYLADPEAYQRLVDENDADGVMELLTNTAVEAQVLRRARLKAATYGQEPLLVDWPPLHGEGRDTTSIVAAAAASAVVAAIEAMSGGGGNGGGAGSASDDAKTATKVCPATVESIYRDLIIPLTKDVEVAYLFRRCGREPPKEYAPDRMSTELPPAKPSSLS